jgi:hypothetical protein
MCKHEPQSCFNPHALPNIETVSELASELCNVLQRFDTCPEFYTKEDYEALLNTINGALFHLYVKMSQMRQQDAPVFAGEASLSTDPIAEQVAKRAQYPGIYLLQHAGVYENFRREDQTPIYLTVGNLEEKVQIAVPVIKCGKFVGYELVTHPIIVQHIDGGDASTVFQSEAEGAPWVHSGTDASNYYTNAEIEEEAGRKINAVSVRDAVFDPSTGFDTATHECDFAENVQERIAAEIASEAKPLLKVVVGTIEDYQERHIFITNNSQKPSCSHLPIMMEVALTFPEGVEVEGYDEAIKMFPFQSLNITIKKDAEGKYCVSFSHIKY